MILRCVFFLFLFLLTSRRWLFGCDLILLCFRRPLRWAKGAVNRCLSPYRFIFVWSGPFCVFQENASFVRRAPSTDCPFLSPRGSGFFRCIFSSCFACRHQLSVSIKKWATCFCPCVSLCSPVCSVLEEVVGFQRTRRK